jgi:hypothetical protein
MRSIWGSSPSDVYVVGHNDRGFGKMFHFDGTKWNAIDPLPVGFIDLTTVYGFSSNDVWVVGMRYIESPELGYSVDSSLIIHYDGTSWKEMNLPGRGRMLLSIAGASPNSVWASGWNALYRYNGTTVEHFPIWMPEKDMFLNTIAVIAENDVYMLGTERNMSQPNDTTIYYLYHFNGNNWSILDSYVETSNSPAPGFGTILCTVDNKLYSVWVGIYEWNGAGWTKLLNDEWIYKVGGVSSTNFFACGGMATLYHYNGSDWKRITLPLSTDVAFYGIWTDGREAFIVGHDGNRTFIAHGK